MRLSRGHGTHLSQVVIGSSWGLSKSPSTSNGLSSLAVLTCYLLYHRTSGSADSCAHLSRHRVSESKFFLKPKTCQSLPSMFVSIDFTPCKCQHATDRNSSASAANSSSPTTLTCLSSFPMEHSPIFPSFPCVT